MLQMTAEQRTSWFVKAGAVFVLIFAVCWAVPRIIDAIPDLPPQTTDLVQQSVFDSYFMRPTPAVAIVGSSLAMRLREEYFSVINIENVALPGGSPLTGLEIIERATKRKPRVIVVETNILSRGVDDALVKRYEGTGRPIDHLRPLRALAAYFLSVPLRPAKMEESARAALLRSKPAPVAPALQKIALETVPEFNKPTYDSIIRRDAATLKVLVDRLRAHGVQVHLFEMPVSPQHGATRYYETMRSEINRLFSRDDILRLDYGPANLHWNDGSHLDERSALIVSGALERVLTTRIP